MTMPKYIANLYTYQDLSRRNADAYANGLTHSMSATSGRHAVTISAANMDDACAKLDARAAAGGWPLGEWGAHVIRLTDTGAYSVDQPHLCWLIPSSPEDYRHIVCLAVEAAKAARHAESDAWLAANDDTR